MTVTLAELLSVLLFAGCLAHAWTTEGRAWAQQWFVAGYLFSLVRESLFSLLQNVGYAPSVLLFGNAPVALALNFASLAYLAFVLARSVSTPAPGPLPLRRPPSSRAPRPILDGPLQLGSALSWRIFALAAALSLPLEYVGTSLGWWDYPFDTPYRAAAAVPLFIPFAWGASVVLFAYVFSRVDRIRLRGSGRLFALITASPLIALLAFILYVLLEFLTGALVLAALAPFVYLLWLALFVLLPLSQLLWPARARPASETLCRDDNLDAS